MPWSTKNHAILSIAFGVVLLSSASASFLDNLVVANINDLYTSYLLSYTENDFKSLNFSSSILGGKAILGNAMFVAGAVALLSLLPESAFCFLKGTCQSSSQGYGQKNGVRFYDNYRAHWRNQRQKHRRAEYDLDYYTYDEPEIVKRKGLEAKRSKRSDGDVDVEYYEDQDYLPAEHRQLTAAQSRHSNPIMEAFSEIFFGNPLRRMTKSWSDIYQHYEDFWRFRLANPGANYRHHLRRVAHDRHLRHSQAQSRSDQ